MNIQNYNNLKLSLISLALLYAYCPAFAQTKNGDSVMNPGLNTASGATKVTNVGKVNQGSYTTVQSVQYQSASCPTGFTGPGGGTTYHTQQRLVTQYYNGGSLVSTSYGPWQAVDEDCAQTQNQTISCPAGQTGSITQTRNVAYGSAGYEYGPWTNSNVSCTPVPVCNPKDVSSSATCSSVYGSGYNGTIYYNTHYSCDANGNLVAGTKTYSYDTCTTPPPPPVYVPPPPTCTPTYTIRTAGCPSGYTGNTYYVTNYSCNSSGQLIKYPEAYLSDTCQKVVAPPPPPVICWYADWPNTYSCPAGQTGSITSTSYNVCPSGPYSPGYQYEGPKTNNCTPIPPPPPPPPAGCEWEFGYAPIGATSNPCHIGYSSGNYPQGQTYTCKASGWVQTKAGSPTVRVWCD